jgi:hypothetical protein
VLYGFIEILRGSPGCIELKIWCVIPNLYLFTHNPVFLFAPHWSFSDPNFDAFVKKSKNAIFYYCHKIQLDFALAGLENDPTSLSGKSGKAISDRYPGSTREVILSVFFDSVTE